MDSGLRRNDKQKQRGNTTATDPPTLKDKAKGT
jgi:hypothetical protein